MTESPSSSGLDEAPLFSARFSYGLAVLLLVPFVISMVTTVEPFPAMVFPAGRSTLRIKDGVITLSQIDLSVADDARGRHHLSPVRFLDPIPLHYFGWMLRSGFGFSDAPTQRVELRQAPISFKIPRHVSNAAERRSLRRWIAARIRSQRQKPGRVLVTRYTVSIDAATGKILSREPGDEKPLTPE